MSIVPSQPSGYVLPSAVAAQANRNLSETSQARGDQSVQNLRQGQDQLADRDIGDVLETSLSADRDVDGRLPYDLPPEEQTPETAEEAIEPSADPSIRSQDTHEELGNRLDLDA